LIMSDKYILPILPDKPPKPYNNDGVAKTHQLLRCSNCSRHCGVPKYASFLDNCAPCIWRFLLSHPLILLSCESIKTCRCKVSRDRRQTADAGCPAIHNRVRAGSCHSASNPSGPGQTAQDKPGFPGNAQFHAGHPGRGCGSSGRACRR